MISTYVRGCVGYIMCYHCIYTSPSRHFFPLTYIDLTTNAFANSIIRRRVNDGARSDKTWAYKVRVRDWLLQILRLIDHAMDSAITSFNTSSLLHEFHCNAQMIIEKWAELRACLVCIGSWMTMLLFLKTLSVRMAQYIRVYASLPRSAEAVKFTRFSPQLRTSCVYPSTGRN